MIGHLRDMRWTIAVSVLIGIFLSPISGISPLMPAYDAMRPVVSMQGEIVARGPDSVTIRMWGTKNRDCKFINIQGFSKKQPDGLSRDATGERLDMPSEGATKPTGAFEIGTWRFRPVIDARIVEVYVQHDCDGRAVVTQIARVAL